MAKLHVRRQYSSPRAATVSRADRSFRPALICRSRPAVPAAACKKKHSDTLIVAQQRYRAESRTLTLQGKEIMASTVSGRCDIILADVPTSVWEAIEAAHLPRRMRLAVDGSSAELKLCACCEETSVCILHVPAAGAPCVSGKRAHRGCLQRVRVSVCKAGTCAAVDAMCMHGACRTWTQPATAPAGVCDDILRLASQLLPRAT